MAGVLVVPDSAGITTSAPNLVGDHWTAKPLQPKLADRFGIDLVCDSRLNALADERLAGRRLLLRLLRRR